MTARGLLASNGRMIVRHPVLVIATWLVIAGSLFAAIPPLAVVAQRNPPDFLPKDSPTIAAGQQMKVAFNEAGATNLVAVILVNENGLTDQDEDTYRKIVENLRARTDIVVSMQDFISIKEIRPAMSSKDGKAWNLPVSLNGTMGTGPGQKAYREAVKIIEETTAGTTLTPSIVGAAATMEDVTDIALRDQLLIEVSTVVTVLLILIIVYRNLVAMVIPLLSIGICLAVAQQVVAGLGLLGLGLAPQTIVLITGMMVGAGVDYAVFLFSRYQEHLRGGMATDAAIVAALVSIGEVIAGSAGTVAITFLALSFATLSVFSTVGPALAVTIFIGFLGSITLLPAFIVLAGRKGWVNPRKDITGPMWRRMGVSIVRRPKLNLFGSLVVLMALAGCALLVDFNYDDRKNLPTDSESNQSYETMNAHFPASASIQQFIVVHSDTQDLRSPRALADMEQMANRISQLPDIAAVRGITRPNGEMLTEARATHQAGEVGDKLGEATNLIDENDSRLTQLSEGAHTLAGALDKIRDQVMAAAPSVRTILTSLVEIEQEYGGAATLNDIDVGARLITVMRNLGRSMGVGLEQVVLNYTWMAPMVAVLDNSPMCTLDPACNAVRVDMKRIVTAYDDGTIQQLYELSKQMETTQEGDGLQRSVGGVTDNLEKALGAADQLGLNRPEDVEAQMDELLTGVNTLADSSAALAQGVQLLVDQTRQMGGGLSQASDFLLAMKRDAADPSMSGFYIPPQILTRPEFEKAAKLFISEDGHTARYMVQTALDPFGSAAMDQVDDIITAAESSRPNTTLADADIQMVGGSVVQNEIRGYYNSDIRYIVLVTLIVVFLILALLLRAIVAPLYLMLSVVLSYMSALGIAVVFFQIILDQPIFWNTPGFTFLVLVAVGADYNLLLISRIREEAHRGTKVAVIRTIGATGGVITSAGLIFAASMLAMTVSSIAAIVQLGFIIGVGLLLDTFLVRTITVPALAVMLGEKNWWPSVVPSDLKRRLPFGKRGPAADETKPMTFAVDDDPVDDDTDVGYGVAVAKASMVTAAWRGRD
ncbi:RND family transporter [Mycolicibacterium frederiksbergense]|uniref:RND family transporter n=2 Tax=Mycolicibacterium frederiksbergense TaxID=117567 RepID=A0A6H0SDK8_9MYCO|nr:RND family transporter [Mycolicibacterium frederiksbergense]